MQNYLLPILQNYFMEILPIKARLHFSSSLIESSKDQLKQQNATGSMISSAVTSYRDLTKIQGGENLGIPNCVYEVLTAGLQQEVENIISQHSCYAVSQSYEVFESFLISIISEFLFQNQQHLPEVKIKSDKIFLLLDTIREAVKKKQGTNNRDLLKIVRKLCLHFRQYEHNNIHGVDISQWFDLLTMIRHTLVHNRQAISHRLLDYIDSRKSNELFNRQFRRRKIDDSVCIFLDNTLTEDIITWLNTFAHFIFVSLSTEANLYLYVPQYEPPPLQF